MLTRECALDGAAVVLTLDRPEAKNALSRALCQALLDGVREACADAQARAVIIAARGEIFAAGGDLDELAALPRDAGGAERVLELGRAVAALEDASVPIIAAVQGDALGGGAELCLACDLCVMEESAQLRFVHARMGLVPAWGGATRLTERAGAARAAELLLTARPVGAAEAVALGIASRVAPKGGALAEALALATAIAASERDAITRVKRSLVAVRRAGRGDSFSRERELFREAWGSDAHQKAMQAFFAKRRRDA